MLSAFLSWTPSWHTEGLHGKADLVSDGGLDVVDFIVMVGSSVALPPGAFISFSWRLSWRYSSPPPQVAFITIIYLFVRLKYVLRE